MSQLDVEDHFDEFVLVAVIGKALMDLICLLMDVASKHSLPVAHLMLVIHSMVEQMLRLDYHWLLCIGTLVFRHD